MATTVNLVQWNQVRDLSCSRVWFNIPVDKF